MTIDCLYYHSYFYFCFVRYSHTCYEWCKLLMNGLSIIGERTGDGGIFSVRNGTVCTVISTRSAQGHFDLGQGQIPMSDYQETGEEGGTIELYMIKWHSTRSRPRKCWWADIVSRGGDRFLLIGRRLMGFGSCDHTYGASPWGNSG